MKPHQASSDIVQGFAKYGGKLGIFGRKTLSILLGHAIARKNKVITLQQEKYIKLSQDSNKNV